MHEPIDNVQYDFTISNDEIMVRVKLELLDFGEQLFFTGFFSDCGCRFTAHWQEIIPGTRSQSIRCVCTKKNEAEFHFDVDAVDSKKGDNSCRESKYLGSMVPYKIEFYTEVYKWYLLLLLKAALFLPYMYCSFLISMHNDYHKRVMHIMMQHSRRHRLYKEDYVRNHEYS